MGVSPAFWNFCAPAMRCRAAWPLRPWAVELGWQVLRSSRVLWSWRSGSMPSSCAACCCIARRETVEQTLRTCIVDICCRDKLLQHAALQPCVVELTLRRDAVEVCRVLSPQGEGPWSMRYGSASSIYAVVSLLLRPRSGCKDYRTIVQSRTEPV